MQKPDKRSNNNRQTSRKLKQANPVDGLSDLGEVLQVNNSNTNTQKINFEKQLHEKLRIIQQKQK